jgi:outer membrane immunogenic protein
MKTVLSTLAIALSMSGASFAADAVVDYVPGPVVEAFSWSGIHIGVGGGGGYNTYDGSSAFYIDSWNNVPSYMDIEGPDGKFYGFGTVEIGADYQFKNSPFVAGILASYDFNFSTDSESRSDTDYEYNFDCDCYPYDTRRLKASLDDTWFLGGRVGFVSQERTLWYGLAGYTWAKGHVDTLLGFNGPDGDDFGQVRKSGQVGGATLGLGVEHAFTDALSLKAEYRHDFLGSVRWDEVPYDPEWGGYDDGNFASGNVDFGRDTVRLVLSYRFNMRN